MPVNFSNKSLHIDLNNIDNIVDSSIDKKPLVLIDFFRYSQDSNGAIKIKGMKNLVFVVEYINIGPIEGVINGTWKLQIDYTSGSGSVNALSFNVNTGNPGPLAPGRNGASPTIFPKTIIYDNRVFLPINENETLTITGRLEGSPRRSKNVFASGGIYRIQQ